MNRLEELMAANKAFLNQITPESLPTKQPERLGIITCMDARINLEALGIPQFTEDGSSESAVRIIRTAGARVDEPSLVVGAFLAGMSEWLILGHTDCGACAAYNNIDTVIANMEARLGTNQLKALKSEIGAPYRENLQGWLNHSHDPKATVIAEVERIKNRPFFPQDIILHGALYHVETGEVELLVNGYE